MGLLIQVYFNTGYLCREARWDTPGATLEEQEAQGQAGKLCPEQKPGRQESCREVYFHGPGYHWLGAGLPDMLRSWIYQISHLSLPSPLLFLA